MSTKHCTEKYRLSNTSPTKIASERCWLFLILSIIHYIYSCERYFELWVVITWDNMKLSFGTVAVAVFLNLIRISGKIISDLWHNKETTYTISIYWDIKPFIRNFDIFPLISPSELCCQYKRTDYDIKNYQSVLPVKHMMLPIKTTITSLLNISTFKTAIILHVKINSYTLRVELQWLL